MGRQAFDCYGIDPTFQKILEKFRDRNEALERLPPGLKLNQDINVAARSRFTPRMRPKQSKSPHAQLP